METPVLSTNHTVADFQQGERVQIVGLQSQNARRYNGVLGRVNGIVGTSHRLRVQIRAGGELKELSVKPTNLQKLAVA